MFPFKKNRRSVLDALIPLFVPYCGGITYQPRLESALHVLLQGEWDGERLLAGGGSHRFTLGWQGEPAPMENLSCNLRFPDHPDVIYDFTVPAHQMVAWLLLRDSTQLPESFWRWLLTGEPPRDLPRG